MVVGLSECMARLFLVLGGGSQLTAPSTDMAGEGGKLGKRFRQSRHRRGSGWQYQCLHYVVELNWR